MTIRYTEIFESFPPDLRLPIARLVDALKEEFGVSKADFGELKGIVRDLTEAQKRTEVRVEELVEAQKRTDTQIEKLTRAVNDLAQAQKILTSQIGGLGARWGLQTEEAFRQGMRTILQEVGFTTERFLEYDVEGEVFGRPDQVELDVVMKDSKLIIVEIKSSLSKADTYAFHRKVAFYVRKTGRRVDRKVIVTPFADDRTKELAGHLGVEICTDVMTL